MGEGIALGGYEYNDLKTMDDKSFNISEIEVINANEDQLNENSYCLSILYSDFVKYIFMKITIFQSQ